MTTQAKRARLDKDLAALPDMSGSQLQERWDLMGEGKAPNLPASVLRPLLAQRLQERCHGPLPAAVRQELNRLAKAHADGERPALPIQLSPGTRLVREWNGRTISVEVLDEGFAYNGGAWRSLSEIARHVTGTRWSGPRFFGLTSNG